MLVLPVLSSISADAPIYPFLPRSTASFLHSSLFFKSQTTARIAIEKAATFNANQALKEAAAAAGYTSAPHENKTVQAPQANEKVLLRAQIAATSFHEKRRWQIQKKAPQVSQMSAADEVRKASAVCERNSLRALQANENVSCATSKQTQVLRGNMPILH